MSEELLPVELQAQANTEAAVIAELAAKPLTQECEPVPTLAIIPPGWVARTIYDESLNPWPARSRGTASVYDAPSFIDAVSRRTLAGEYATSPVIYADEAECRLIAVLNDDGPSQPGWRDYRVALQLRLTPEWMHWIRRDGQLLEQEDFAQHIEDGLAELSEPSPATMLELAQTFHATTSAAFKGGSRLASGARQFRYEEEIDASAGATGTIEIPERLKITVVPFYGASRYEVGAWFRFRLSRDNFRLGYKLDRPHEILRAAFADIRDAVAASLANLDVIAGPAPEAPAAIRS